VIRNITASVNIGFGEGKTDTQKTLSDALAVMDDALLKVVEANKVAFRKLTDGGASFEESSWKKVSRNSRPSKRNSSTASGMLSKALAIQLRDNEKRYVRRRML
jgi:Family of unknown function (DUF6781)